MFFIMVFIPHANYKNAQTHWYTLTYMYMKRWAVCIFYRYEAYISVTNFTSPTSSAICVLSCSSIYWCSNSVLGVSMASLTELSFNWTGFISAMISNIAFTYRSIYSKKAMVRSYLKVGTIVQKFSFLLYLSLSFWIFGYFICFIFASTDRNGQYQCVCLYFHYCPLVLHPAGYNCKFTSLVDQLFIPIFPSWKVLTS